VSTASCMDGFVGVAGACPLLSGMQQTMTHLTAGCML
jgi:hypothetical protein